MKVTSEGMEYYTVCACLRNNQPKFKSQITLDGFNLVKLEMCRFFM